MSGSRYSQSSFSYSSSRSTARSAGFLSELSSAVSRNGTKITSETVHQSEEMSVHEEVSEISTSSATEKQKEVELVHNIGMTLRQMRALKREQNQQTTASSQQLKEVRPKQEYDYDWDKDLP